MSEQTWAEYWEQVRASVGKSLCPRCGGSLEPAPYHPAAGQTAVGWCKKDQLYWKAGLKLTGVESGYYLEGQRRAYQQAMGWLPDC